MRPMALSVRTEDDVKAVAHYVETLTPVPHAPPFPVIRKPERRSYATCASCHGDNGAGNQDLGAPRIAGTDDWYLATELRKFKTRHSRRESQGSRGAVDAPHGADPSR